MKYVIYLEVGCVDKTLWNKTRKHKSYQYSLRCRKAMQV